MQDPSLVRFRKVVVGALAHLESRREEINDLNVFPVADGDTGDNMALTLRAVLDEMDRLLADPDQSIDQIGRDALTESLARAALLGARGNSGVILSQLIRGAAEELVSRPGELVDPIMIGAAMARAAQRAYDSVRQPAEGTMLTVMREMAQRIALELPNMANPRLGHEWNAKLQDAMIADVLERALLAGEEAVRRGPELLPVLKEAGVVDAGGHAVTILFAGVVAALRGTEGPEIPRHAAAVRVTHPEHESSTFRYCTNFAVTGTGLDANDHVARLEAIGDSVLVVGDAATLKVHVHTDDPETATRLFAPPHVVSHLDVADMHLQVAEREARLSAAAGQGARSGALAVVAGAGMVALYEGLGVRTLDGGQTLNPSTYELLAGIHQVPAEEVVVLPNSSNVFMAAERAADLSDKVVHVVESRSQQAGLAAAIALVPDRSAEENAGAMRDALAGVRTGAVARAGREDARGRFAEGDAIAFVDDVLVAWGSPRAALGHVLEALDEGAELITCILGADAPLDADAVAAMANGVELEVQDGGQPAYWYLLTAE
ncbi:MAG: domain fusion protein YloV [Solirubrobacterales bacterium]|jgi:DAK2 domain fusion protein YloV|nr:domain fusion protein YloV [Solirubrobacterales bacterium]